MCRCRVGGTHPALVFGAADPKAGATGTLYNLAADPRLNHETRVLPGVRAHECAELLSDVLRTSALSAVP